MALNIIERLQAEYGQLTKMQKKTADYIVSNMITTAFMTVNQLSNAIGTSTTTIIRLANHFGYLGYSDFQAALQEMIINNPPSRALEGMGENREIKDRIVAEIANTQFLNQQKTIHTLSDKAISEAVNLLLAANYIYTVGSRSSYCVAYFLARHLGRLLGKCDLLSSDSGNIAEKILRIKEGDVLVAISVPRYLNNSLSVAGCAKALGAKIISITGETSPLREYSDVLIPVSSQSGSFFRSMIPSMMVAEIIVGMVGQLNADSSKAHLKAIENLENDKTLTL